MPLHVIKWIILCCAVKNSMQCRWKTSEFHWQILWNSLLIPCHQVEHFLWFSIQFHVVQSNSLCNFLMNFMPFSEKYHAIQEENVNNFICTFNLIQEHFILLSFNVIPWIILCYSEENFILYSEQFNAIRLKV